MSQRFPFSVFVGTFAALTTLALASPMAHAQTYTSSGGPFSIPDGTVAGISSTITVTDTFTLLSFNSITITGLTHTWSGDLIATLTHGSVTVDIFDRIVGNSASVGDSSDFNGNYTFALGGADINAAATALGATGIIDPGVTYAPYLGGGLSFGTPGGSTSNTQTFTNFAGSVVQGAWTLNVSDRAGGDTGSFTGWSFNVTQQSTGSAAPEPGSLALLLPAMGALGMVARRRKK